MVTSDQSGTSSPSGRRWGVGAEGYQRPSLPRQATSAGSRAGQHRNAAAAERREQLALTGITWDLSEVDLNLIGGGPGEFERARHRFRERKPDFIWDAARLEGNTFTLPEVRTLLEGVTVEGKRLEDQDQILALNEGFNDIDLLIGVGKFSLSKPVSDRIHAKVAVHEAIEAGNFRGEGSVNGGGDVILSTGGVIAGREHGEGGSLLIAAYADLLDYLIGETDPRVRALVYAAAVIRHQLYFDANKRTAKLMASGELMMHGYDAISIPYTRLYEQNVALDELFQTDDATSLMRLMADCAR
ncbi:Fic family protein [Agromyces marinus]|uniref:Fido domain-containing protein n=1 Tax=Agromyces marinus TaxID=1389020 RepID=A0ABN6YFF2_9MICO|nr:hypothetical protein [Agromyces marinus]UIP58954.1 hypothetical protein DSM26151_18440 [Agromyces marinus]BDZ56080.1 hypothetical protein GCM10025870_31530 [Agromyces marinus]